MAKSLHDEIAEKLAKKFGTEYKSDEGIDIVDKTRKRVIEVETKRESLSQGIDQVKRSSLARYLAVPKSLVKKASETTENTGIGVMSGTGRILKRASRKN